MTGTHKPEEPASERNATINFVLTIMFVAFCAAVVGIMLALPIARIESMKPCASSTENNK